MKLLEERIKKDGKVLNGDVLKVDSFINHQLDVPFLCALGKEFKRLYEGTPVTKILTVEASGIAIACLTAQYFGVPVVFAKKSKSSNIGDDLYSAEVKSYTHGNVNRILISKDFLKVEDKILIIDDFLASGNALRGLIELCDQAGAAVQGCGVVIEKAYQNGGALIRQRCRVEALARISSMDERGVCFVESGS